MIRSKLRRKYILMWDHGRIVDFFSSVSVPWSQDLLNQNAVKISRSVDVLES
jgi:hypothetical protein